MVKAVTTTLMALPQGAYFQQVKMVTIEESSKVMQLDDELYWIDPLINFLENGQFHANQKETYKIKYKFSKYLVHEGNLSKWSFSLPLLRCLCPSKVEYALKEVYEKICSDILERMCKHTSCYDRVIIDLWCKKTWRTLSCSVMLTKGTQTFNVFLPCRSLPYVPHGLSCSGVWIF